jgi:hypothetical protein
MTRPIPLFGWSAKDATFQRRAGKRREKHTRRQTQYQGGSYQRKLYVRGNERELFCNIHGTVCALNPDTINPTSCGVADSCQRATRRSDRHIQILELLACGNLTRPAHERYSSKPPCPTIRRVWNISSSTKTVP